MLIQLDHLYVSVSELILCNVSFVTSTAAIIVVELPDDLQPEEPVTSVDVGDSVLVKYDGGL